MIHVCSRLELEAAAARLAAGPSVMPHAERAGP